LKSGIFRTGKTLPQPAQEKTIPFEYDFLISGF